MAAQLFIPNFSLKQSKQLKIIAQEGFGMPETSEQTAEKLRQLADSMKQSADRLQDTTDIAQQAAETAQRNADSFSYAMSATTGGVIDPLVFQLSIFVLAVFVGYYVVWSVTPALHTPLMAVTNAISSVIVVGALLAAGVNAAPALGAGPIWARALGFFALVFAAINIFGGFLVTKRMLAMYQAKKPMKKA